MVVLEKEAEVVFDSGWSAEAENGLLLDFEQSSGSSKKELSAKEVPMIVVAPLPFFEKPGERQYDCSWK